MPRRCNTHGEASIAAWNSCRSAPVAAPPAPPASGAAPRTERMATVLTCSPSWREVDRMQISRVYQAKLVTKDADVTAVRAIHHACVRGDTLTKVMRTREAHGWKKRLTQTKTLAVFFYSNTT